MNKELEIIRAQIPRLKCKGLCAEFCRVAPCSPIEAEIIKEKYGEIPLPTTNDFKCNHLDENNRCKIYPDRPLICRQWGATDSMKCKYGCRPRNYLTGPKAWRMLRRADRIPSKTGIDPIKILEAAVDRLIVIGKALGK